MANERRPVDDLAAAILDGATVNWEAAEATSPAPDRDLVPYLRLLARIAEAHRGGPTGGVGTETERASTWGHLTILEGIGAGAFGEVYRARDRRLDREVALKLLNADQSHGDGSTVIAEGRLLARVRHPNIVTVYGAERVDGRIGLWMEFIRGRRLDELLREQGPFSAHEAALIGLSICRALSAVHHAGLVHRDIKAQNVMREEGGRVLLMDFGTGLLIDDGDSGKAGLAGTPLYLAPELFVGGESTVQSDIYSVGVLLFHLVTGSFPVLGATLGELRDAHAADRRRFLRDQRPDISGDFMAVVEQAIDPVPGRRYQTAGAMEAALARAVGAEPRRGPGVRHWLLGSTVAALVLMALIATIGLWSDRGFRRSSGLAPPGAPSLGVSDSSSVVVRTLPLPLSLLVGRPSADGQLFSYSDVNGNLALYETATGRSRRLTNVEAESNQFALYSAISADGRFVAYTWHALDGKHEMRVIGTDGKRARVVMRQEGVDFPQPVGWSRDGRSILSIVERSDGTNQIALVAVDGSPVRIVAPLGAGRPQHASLSPDGEFVVFDAPQGPAQAARDVFIARSSGSEPNVFVQHAANDFAPVWTPDGQRLVFASDRSGAVDLWSVGVENGVPQGEPDVVHRGLGRMWVLGLTDEGAYYHQRVMGAVDVYVAEVAPDGHVGKPQPLGPSYAGSNISSAWSPDGRHVAYASRRGFVSFDRGSTTLVIRELVTGGQREFVPALTTFLVRSWSRDGRHVLVSGTDSGGRSGLFAIDSETGRTMPVIVPEPRRGPRATAAEWASGLGLILHSKGRGLFFHDPIRGTDELALDFRAEGVEGINRGPMGPGFAASPDARSLAFSAMLREADVLTYSLRVKAGDEPSRELLRVRDPERLLLQSWTPDGAALLFTRRKEGEPPRLWRISTEGGVPVPLDIPIKGVRDVSMHPDGRRITFTSGSPLLEVWVIENLLSKLGRP